MAESADAVDLKPTDLGHEGSTPSGPTNKQLWEAEMPASELPVALGQKRLIAIDGFGCMDGEIVAMDDDYVTLKIISEYHTGSVFELRWELGPNTFVGLLLDGEELKKILAEEALSVEYCDSNQA